jgi:hypothetical protein
LDNGEPLLWRGLGIFIDVLDGVTVSGNWTMIVDGKVMTSIAVLIIPFHAAPLPNVIVQHTEDGTTRFSCDNDPTGTVVLSVWRGDGSAEHYNKLHEPQCFMGNVATDIVSRRCKDYTLFYNNLFSSQSQNYRGNNSYWTYGSLMGSLYFFVFYKPLEPLHRRVFIELPGYVSPVELYAIRDVRVTIQFTDSFIKTFYQAYSENMAAYKTVQSKNIYANLTMECDGGKILYVSNDFCEEEWAGSIEDVRAQYAIAANKTAYRFHPLVKKRCQYKVREANFKKTVVGFGCYLSRYYCFQTPFVEKREVKFIPSLQQDINPEWSYTLNEDMCAPGVIENSDYSSRDDFIPSVYEAFFGPSVLYKNLEDFIMEIADVHNTSQIPTSTVYSRIL